MKIVKGGRPLCLPLHDHSAMVHRPQAALLAANGPLGAANPDLSHSRGTEANVTGAGKTITATFSWNTLGASGTAILVAALDYRY